ncbi:MAG TPA: hypothetical protein VHF07_02480 [Nitrospiraceae bacterium]|nr:hypothetical protein [Nitrospiraceae bacterium]
MTSGAPLLEKPLSSEAQILLRNPPLPAVVAGSFLTVLDGELQNSGWVYSVSTDDGRQGWIAEKNLRFRR